MSFKSHIAEETVSDNERELWLMVLPQNEKYTPKSLMFCELKGFLLYIAGPLSERRKYHNISYLFA